MREARFKALGKLIGALGGADHGAERADHREDARYVALVEDVDGDARAHQIGGDIRLQVGEGQHQIGLECENFRDIRGDEGGNPRLLAADLRRPHRIAGDADDAVLLAEQVQRFDGLFGEANDPAGWELAHGAHMPNSGRHVTAAITSEVIA
jgi:hypothetical protein